MFIDNVKIFVKAGNGGKGCRSFYRDKYTRHGIPDGGDGGKGADIVIRADRHLRTLLDLRYHREFRGSHGAHGSGNKRKGKNAPAVVIRVPVGTVIKDAVTASLLRDLDKVDEEVVVARGGNGGLGNIHKHIRESMPGEAGQEKELILDLKLIADVGVVGYPNAGKSTLVTALSNAHPEIAAYPFTTKFPILGVVGSGQDAFVIADIPGLIEGASQGRGLGDRFLRHIERTKILVHLVDMAAVEGRDPLQDYRAINKELAQYSPAVQKKTQVLVANKMDLETAGENLKMFKKSLRKKVYPVSALQKSGLEELIEGIREKL